MYELSRELFRALRPGLLVDPRHPTRNQRSLLAICEESVALIATNPASGLLQTRRLFARARFLFPVSVHVALLDAIERGVERIVAEFTSENSAGRGTMLRCAATTRRGKPCLREPLLGCAYCPSHKHLERPREVAGAMLA